jgi:hypothetical protein
MNASQHAKYIRCWINVVRANHWVMRKGRLADDATSGDKSEWHAAVWAAATALALPERRAVAADDLRKGCHVVAFGRAKSSKVLSNSEFNSLLTLWGNERPRSEGGLAGLLIEPLDIASITAWRKPEAGEIEGIVRKIHSLKIPDAVVDGVCRSNFPLEYSAPFFEDLPLIRLRLLLRILLQIAERETSNIQHSTPNSEVQPELETQPF